MRLDRENEEMRQAATWQRLHRRSMLGAVLLMGLVVAPFVTLLAWINWAIVFRGKEWSLQISHPGIPEAAAGLLAVIALIYFCRAIAFWLGARGEFWTGSGSSKMETPPSKRKKG